MKKTILFSLALVLGIINFSANRALAQSSVSGQANIIGRVEYVVLQDVHVKLKARIDTGAGVSSLNAKILRVTHTNDGELVEFQIKDEQGKTTALKRKIIEWIEIKVLGSDKKNRRPVVRMDFCLGGHKLEGRVNLNDRSGFLYPIIMGRNILKTGDFLIDPRRKFVKDPGCK